MSIELQNLDCNCNNCIHMIRDLEKFKESTEMHYKWQLNYFNTITNNLIESAKKWLKKGDPKKHDAIMKEVSKRKFQFDKSTLAIQFGRCSKFNKNVSFIPNTLQLHTQDCFTNRKQTS